MITENWQNGNALNDQKPAATTGEHHAAYSFIAAILGTMFAGTLVRRFATTAGSPHGNIYCPRKSGQKQ
ncbi:hypothetical protein [Mucilaginibacter sp. L3T2-6]|uniref:hypothetical protein n=1 Tax=Mucilaginibacter sp. L3T2-6 TaxID=3062491 RepID=UPI002674BD23|nr:hypothetical protein [Mucilaginibacter sp. L3T2-6]MDO3641483.1 hypothetical protein [Mucilaginibacter sp. L3T2-6]MDV6213756.1 hypothetical protein [Mucilaginibacter sp. L3T2-6]